MANTAQAKKRSRQNEQHRARNGALRSAMRTQIKKVLKAVQEKDKPGAQTAYRQAVSVIDRVAGRGILHKNGAARYKSRLNERIKAL
ncbi:MAG: 30S ribosomal protein S20 [Acidiferrobacteraceae bacterium]|jgi:small subunit ribosomal protein S20